MQRPNAVTTALKLFVILLLALTLAACASKDRPRPGDVAADGEAVGVDTEVRPLGRDGRPIAGPMGAPGSAISQRLVYFDFDRDAIASEFLPVVNAHAEYLANNPQARIRLEGHTDERGSREYNLGLGERRAMAVQRQMLLQGARASQIRVISYGEELPAQMGSDEQAWAQNRRVEIVYERGSQ
ncbi:peptidoglycan-associated lipoprotein [Ectothiorhodosinus mongolicus]|uniref:Peptidoglycan-associated lipoprotein n=1 Tax=Ectothiorhodosinus mongolicus TaxID=233100 RepID=A0A1R3W2Y6_9GAMM|nr:peptidoglycan-associated lipoprotein Pal [Ectothiorhodosinus mongolicus]ULX57387.1 peptidoglycan-associated lipoprotein [Ectothiorhodosinus mongolicus]SIT71327.1 peptidoglycan-associated lipoprotein [Ectothiorhodosinus mongolicus]